MKSWGTIATILMVVFLGTSIWLYVQNKDLNTKVSTANSAKATAEENLTSVKGAAGKKVQVLSIFFNYPGDQSKMAEAKSLVTEMNDATLSADWKTMEQKGDSTSGTKMLKDLISALAKDLGV